MKTLLSITLLFLSVYIYAQPLPPSPTPFGLTELLIGAGAVYGAKKTFDKKRDRGQ